MESFLQTIQSYIKLNDFYSVLSFLNAKEKSGEVVLYAGTYSFETAIERFGSFDSCSFYIYTSHDKCGYHIYLNRMGCGMREDNKIFKFSHRYLYNKNHLSNRSCGEPDYRFGEFFKK